jgi:hypothetical protein
MDEKELEHKTSDDYEVGYRKPPKHGRFQKGVSGNPKGRPKVARDIRAAVLRELNTHITITENGRQIRALKAEVIAKQAVNGAMKGKTSHLRLILDTSQQAAEKDALLAEQLARDADNEKRKNYKAMTTPQLEEMLAKQLAASEWSEQSEIP